ncbi:MAG TPA: WD40 repeat domain-containing protein [Kofleriaceae bacterium]|jgi:hypothetical protein
MRCLLVLLLLAACGRTEQDPPPRPPPRVSEPEVEAPPPPPISLGRPAVALGGATTWAAAYNVSELRFCPGDEELLALESAGHLRRYNVADGSQVSTVDVMEQHGSVDCRADGTALALDATGGPLLIDASGKATKPPTATIGQRAMFDDDGNALVLTEEGVTKWAGDQVTPLITQNEKALYTSLAEHGTYFEVIVGSAKKTDDGLWMTRGEKRIKLDKTSVDLEQTAAAPDGAVAIADMMVAWGWTVKGKAAKRELLLDQSGTHIKAIGASDKWFVVIGADGDIWTEKRPGKKWLPIQHPCGENDVPTALALAHDDKRVAVSCTTIGIRIFDLETGDQLTKDGVNTAASLLAWSPTGDRLAIRDATSIRVWKDNAQITKLDATESRSLWWVDANQLGGTERGVVSTWSVDDNQSHPGTLEAEVAAQSPHGEILVAKRQTDGPNAVTLVRGDKHTPITLPDSKWEWLDGVAIDTSGTHALVWRGQYNGEPALQLYWIDLATLKISAVEDKITAAALGAGGYAMATVGGTVLWNAGKPVTLGKHTSEVTALAISHDVIAAGGKDGAITFWTTSGTNLGRLPAHTSALRAIAFAPDGKHLATTAADGTKLWNLTPKGS